MTGRKNPFRIIRVTAQIVGTLALIAFVIFVATVGITQMLSKYGTELLWQLPLAAGVFFGAIFLVFFICSAVASVWRKAESRWDKRSRQVVPSSELIPDKEGAP